MDKKLPEVVCPVCRLVQVWRGQRQCIHRGCIWTNWFHANLVKYGEAPASKAS
jgi:hypothetical protein